jgi:translation initiation factor 3 subunit G
MRGAGGKGPSADARYPGPGGGGSREDLPTLRVTNVSEDVEEDDLRELFQKAIGGERGGRIARVYIGKDRETGQKKGYAFVSFESREVAERAMKMVDGKGKWYFCFLSRWRWWWKRKRGRDYVDAGVRAGMD